MTVQTFQFPELWSIYRPAWDIRCEDPPPEKTYTQVEVDEQIAAVYAREKAKSDRKTGLIADEKAELEEHRREAAARKVQQEAEKGEFQKALKSKDDAFASERTKWAEREGVLLGNLRKDRIYNQILTACTDNDGPQAYNAEHVAKLLSDRVRLDDDFQPQVLDEHGEVAYKDGKPLSVKTLVRTFLDANPHLVRAGADGAGSRGGKSVDDTDTKGESEDVTKLREEYDAAQTLAAQNPNNVNVTKVQQLKWRLEAAQRQQRRTG